MKKIYQKPEAALTVFGSRDITNAIVLSSVTDLTKVKKTDENTVTFGAV